MCPVVSLHQRAGKVATLCTLANNADPGPSTEEMGPTAIVSHSNYWTVDHDDNDDNICIEMLHPISMQRDPDLPSRDRRLNEAPLQTGWPLVRQVQVCIPQVQLQRLSLFVPAGAKRGLLLREARLS